MTATLDGMPRKKDKPEPSPEQRAAEEQVARARGAGPAEAADQDRAGDGAQSGDEYAPVSTSATGRTTHPGSTDKGAVAGSSPKSTRPTLVTVHRASGCRLLGRGAEVTGGGSTEATHSLSSMGYADDVASSIG
jgi:hypothetical protein